MLSRHSIVKRCLGVLLVLWAAPAHASERDILLLTTHITVEQQAEQGLLQEQARVLDQILFDAAIDLGLEPQALAIAAPDEDLPKAATRDWVVAPSLSYDAAGLSLRLTVVAPGSNVLLVRAQRFHPSQLEVKAIVMLQELISAGNTGGGDLAPTASVPRTQTSSDTAPLSSGRAVLALTAAVYGGYVGFTVHNASRSSDARLLYPLTALGAGLGLGGSMLVADEWNITQGSAWYLSAALVWPAVAGITLGEAYDGRAEYRYLYGVLGATGGLTLATTVISLAPTTPGQAALTHSGGAFGTLLGGLTEALINPELNEAPLRGMGYGAALGVLTLGALAPTLETSASRIVFIDLSASLGALTGAALATPLLLVGNDPTQGRSRFWFASVMAGTLVGGALGTYITRNDPDSATATGLDVSGPYVGFLGFSESATGEQRPLFGAELSGTW